MADGYFSEPCLDLDYTTERMVPGRTDYKTFWEHIFRYRFAIRYARGKRVLDIACGEGYGCAALLKGGATSVIGIDISEDVCEHARNKYGVDARQARADALPLPDGSVDLVVSFETIEHVPDPGLFIDECFRVLVRGGTLIMSTPNKVAFEAAGKRSEYHLSELTELQFTSILRQRFNHAQYYCQEPLSVAWWSLRSFAALTSPWHNIRGFWGTRTLLLKALYPYITPEETDRYQIAPVSCILRRTMPVARFVNPYEVRRRISLIREEPVFLVAVARA
jgi:ubiquinone/menaquinone biosynthesis C-methylase UbiE